MLKWKVIERTLKMTTSVPIPLRREVTVGPRRSSGRDDKEGGDSVNGLLKTEATSAHGLVPGAEESRKHLND